MAGTLIVIEKSNSALPPGSPEMAVPLVADLPEMVTDWKIT